MSNFLNKEELFFQWWRAASKGLIYINLYSFEHMFFSKQQKVEIFMGKRDLE